MLGPEAHHQGAVNCAYAETVLREADLAYTYVHKSMGRLQKKNDGAMMAYFDLPHTNTLCSLNASQHFSPRFASLLIRRVHRSFYPPPFKSCASLESWSASMQRVVC
jgi:hypothetical protein